MKDERGVCKGNYEGDIITEENFHFPLPDASAELED